MLFRRRTPLTDEEYIERLRRQVHASRRGPITITIVYGLVVIGLLVMAIRSFLSFRVIADDHGYSLGLLMGSFTGFLIAFSIWNFLTFLFMTLSSFFRMHRLLLKYHDLAAASPAGTTGEATDGPAGKLE